MPSSDDSQLFSPPLNERDRLSVDALADAGFDVARVGGPRNPAARLLDLLDRTGASGGPALLSSSQEADRRAAGTLIDVTIARVMRDRSSRVVAGRLGDEPLGPMLSAADAGAIDDLIESGWSASPTAAADARGVRAASLLALIGAAPSQDTSASLVDATLGRVQRSVDRDHNTMKLSPVEPRFGESRGFSFRLADLGAIAAILVLGVIVLSPMLAGVRERSRELACTGSLQRAGEGFDQYARDHDGRLPATAQASLFDGSWWDVGQERRSHSANLFELARRQYTTLTDLSCAGNRHAVTGQVTDPEQRDWRQPEDVSYSYQLFQGQPPRLTTQARMVVLTDRSPVVERSRRGESPDPAAPSTNHDGHGQNVLLNDGAVMFLFTPFLPGTKDNIWLPRQLNDERRPKLEGKEAPADEQDVFVGP